MPLKSSLTRAVRLAILAGLLLFAGAACFGQRTKADAGEPQADDPAGRAQWLQQGRTVKGESAAALRYRAYRQKMAARALRAQQLSTKPADGAALPRAAVAGGTGAIWQNLGPAPLISDPSGGQDYGNVVGRVTAIAVDQHDATGNTVYVGGAFGGLWRSTNAATTNPANVTWTPLTEDQPTLSIGSIAIKPDDRNTILVGTGETNNSGDAYYGIGILRSTDGGGTWSVIASADAGVHPFFGMGFSRIAFSTDNPNLVVASTASTIGASDGAETTNVTTRGIYYSTNAGATWQLASLTDGGVAVLAGSAHSVVYNPQEHQFYGVSRLHGIFASSDGANWTKLAGQPAPIANSFSCPPDTANFSCPIYRGEIAVRPGSTREMYVWFVNSTSVDGGIFKTTDGGASWTQLSESGLTNCGDVNGCGALQGTFNLYLAALPTATGTDLYAGAVNIFKCSITSANPTCASSRWLNLTHVYGCAPNIGAPAHVHPDQHAVDFLVSNPNIVYFGNDGGVYRTLNNAAMTGGTCSDTNPFGDLNANFGSLSEFNTFSQHPTDPNILLGGLQDNGSPAIAPGQSGANGVTWAEANGGDGGFTEINQASPNEWFTANTGISIQRCGGGTNCILTDSFAPVISSAQVSFDTGSFYTPYMLDPGNTSNLIVGTSRVWRGSSNGIGWPGANAISNSFLTSFPASACTSMVSSDLIRSLAAGGPTQGNGSQVLYAGTTHGRVFVTTNAAGGPSTWGEQTHGINPSCYPISDIYVDKNDATGQTAYITVMGFGTGHVFKTTDAGANWANITGDLPDSPANTVLLDPLVPSIIYVGTDVGAFFSTNGGANWVEYGARLPNVPVTRLRAFTFGSTNKLRASTYGRGLWQVDLAGAPLNPVPALTAPLSPSSATAGGAAFTLIVTGSNFVFGATVQWNGSPRATTFVSSTQLSVSILASDIATAGTASVTAVNPTPGGGQSVTSLTFTINAATPVPVLTSLSPTNTTVGSPDFTLTVTGTGFVSSSVVNWNGSARATTFVSATQLTAAIAAADIAAVGSASVTVVSPPPGGGTSNALTFTITSNPTPVLTSLSPGTATAGGAGFALTVTGSGFVSSSVVNWNGSARATTFVSSTQLTATITAADIATVGTSTVTVFNPAPGGGTSGSVSFFVTAAGTFPFGTSATNIRYWPHIVTGIGYVTKMTITNLTNAQNNVIVYFVSQSGTTTETDSYSLPAAGTVRFTTPESARFASPTTRWAIVNSQAAVAINLFFEVILSPGGTVANTVGFNDSPPLTDFTMPVEFQPASSGFRTVGIACSNINTSAVIISMELIDQNGNIIASSNLNPVSPPSTGALAAFGQTTVDLQSVFGSALPAGNFVGSLTVHAAFASGGAPASVSCLGLEDDLGLFSATPPIPGRAK